MKQHLFLASLLSACTALQVVAQTPGMTTSEPTTLGDLHGVTRGPEGSPVSAATVVAHNLDENTDRVAISGVDGAFKVADLKPGRYELTANKNGVGRAAATTVQLAAKESLNADVTLSGSGAVPAVPAMDVPVSAILEEVAALKKRIEQLEAQLSKKNAPDATAKEVASNTAAPQESKAPIPRPPAPVAPPPPLLPEALAAPVATAGVDNFTPFAYADFTWLNGTPRNKDAVLDTKFFTPEVRFDTYFTEDFNQPIDHSLGGSTETFRSGEFQVEQVSVGGDFHWQNVRGRVLTCTDCLQPRRRATTPAPESASGTSATLTATFRKRRAVITSM